MLRAVASAVAVIACLAAPGVSFAQTPMTIRVYDAAARPAAERAAAIAAARAIFAEAGLRIIWRDCGRNGADHPCANARLPQDLVVRIVPRAAGPETPISAAVSADDDADTEREAAAQPILRLGSAAVATTDRGGVVATVYTDHVQTVTRRTGVPFSLLLGRAIAHEIGHLLPGGDGHTADGLMRPVWTDGELRRNRAEDWMFAPAAAGPGGPAPRVTASAPPQTPRSRSESRH